MGQALSFCDECKKSAASGGNDDDDVSDNRSHHDNKLQSRNLFVVFEADTFEEEDSSIAERIDAEVEAELKAKRMAEAKVEERTARVATSEGQAAVWGQKFSPINQNQGSPVRPVSPLAEPKINEREARDDATDALLMLATSSSEEAEIEAAVVPEGTNPATPSGMSLLADIDIKDTRSDTTEKTASSSVSFPSVAAQTPNNTPIKQKNISNNKSSSSSSSKLMSPVEKYRRFRVNIKSPLKDKSWRSMSDYYLAVNGSGNGTLKSPLKVQKVKSSKSSSSKSRSSKGERRVVVESRL